MLDTKLESEIPVIIEKCLTWVSRVCSKISRTGIFGSILPKILSLKFGNKLLQLRTHWKDIYNWKMYKNYEIKMGENFKFPIDLFEEMFLRFL